MAMVTCRYCKKKIDKDKAYSEKPRIYFCDKDCFSSYYNSDSGELDDFLDYIWKQYSPENQTTEKYLMIKKQAEHYHNQYGFKYKGMLLTAKWYIEIQERYWHNEYGLGQIFPDQYWQLKQFYEEQRALKERLEHHDIHTKERVATGNKRKGKMLELD